MPRKAAAVKGGGKAGKPAKQASPQFDYSKSRIAFKRSYDEFLMFLAGYPDSTGICAYMYRLWPVVDLKRLCPAGEDDTKWPTNIEKVVDLDTLEAASVVERHGSGEYMVKVSDSNRVRGETEVCRAWLSINNPELTPMLDIRTLVLAHPKNESYVQSLVAAGKLELIDGRPSIPRSSRVLGGPVIAGGPPVPSAVDARLARIEAALDSRTPAGGDNTLGRLQEMRELKGLLDSMAGPARGDDLDRLEKWAKLLRNVGGSHEAAAPVPVVDPIENYRRVKDLIADIAPAAASIGGDSWGSMIRDIAAAAPALVQTFLMVRSANAGSAARPVPAPGPVPAAGPAGAGPGAPPVVPISAAPSDEPLFMEPLPEGFDLKALTQDAPRMARLMQVAEQAIKKFKRKVKGFDYAYSVYWTESDGPTVYHVCELIARGPDGELSPEPLLMLFGLHPAAADLMFSRSAELREWLDDFLNFVPEVPEVAVSEVA